MHWRYFYRFLALNFRVFLYALAVSWRSLRYLFSTKKLDEKSLLRFERFTGNMLRTIDCFDRRRILLRLTFGRRNIF